MSDDEIMDESDADDAPASVTLAPAPALKVLTNKGTLNLTILRCKGLARADGFMGKADPYCKIFWEGQEVLESTTKRKTLNPKWTKGEAKVAIDFEGPSAQILLSISLGTESRTEWANKTGWRERPDGVGGASYYNDVTKKGSAGGKLRIEVWDKDTTTDDEFLGCLQKNGWKLAQLADGREHEEMLEDKDGELGTFVKGSIVLCLEFERDETNTIRLAPEGFAGTMSAMFGGVGNSGGGEGGGGEAAETEPTAKSTGGAALVGATGPPT
jgi:hypothetical protein